ncbi:MAG: glutathione S-transferase family protein, partial [Burkholderiales bacterium]
IWPWLRNWQGQGQSMDDNPNLKRWFEQIGNRPAVQRAVKVLADLRKPAFDDKAREVLFGATQYAKR